MENTLKNQTILLQALLNSFNMNFSARIVSVTPIIALKISSQQLSIDELWLQQLITNP